MRYQFSRYEDAGDGLRFLKDLKLLDDVQLTLDLNRFMQPAVVYLRHREKMQRTKMMIRISLRIDKWLKCVFFFKNRQRC